MHVEVLSNTISIGMIGYRIFALGILTRMKVQLLDSRRDQLTREQFERNIKIMKILQISIKPKHLNVLCILSISLAAPIIVFLLYLDPDRQIEGRKIIFSIVMCTILTYGVCCFLLLLYTHQSG